MLNVLLIGLGAIGNEVLCHLHSDPEIRISHVLMRSAGQRSGRALDMLADAHIVRDIDEVQNLPDFALECAGPDAIREHGIPLLLRGVDLGICSIGAFVDEGLAYDVHEAARMGGSQAHLLPGAVGGIDALAAAKLLGLESVIFTSRKPPLGWLGTAAEEICDLRALIQPMVLFRGCARRAAGLYPKNANVAATVALAGIGLDKTEVTLIADPGVDLNTHEIDVRGAFGEMHFVTSNKPLPENPRTSALAALSVIRAIRNQVAAVTI